jgi:prepilin-type processing-associated H-X9-DG protein
MRRDRCHRSAQTLIETVVVIAIIAALIGILIPAVMRARDAGNRARCASNLRQIGLGLANYEAAHGSLPLGSENSTFPYGGPGTTWAVRILPYMEEEDVYRRIDFNKKSASGQVFRDTPNSQGADPVTASLIEVYQCPSDGMGGLAKTSFGTYSRSNYLGIFGQYAYGVDHQRTEPFGPNFGARYSEITDGTSNTLIVSEYLTGLPRNQGPHDLRGVFWLDRAGSSQIFTRLTPNSEHPDVLEEGTCYDSPGNLLPCIEVPNILLDNAGARSRHRGGVNGLMADGSVRFFSDKIKTPEWQALGTTSGGDGMSAGAGRKHHSGGTSVASTAGKKEKGDSDASSSPLSPHIRDHYMIKGASAAAIKKLGGEIKGHIKEINTVVAYIPPSAVNQIKSMPGVTTFEHDLMVSTCTQTTPTGIRRINADKDSYKSGSGTGPQCPATVAVIDTGIDLTHPDLNVVFNKGFSFPDGNDDHGHGTHVSGTIGAIDNDQFVVGVAKGCNLWALKVLDSNGTGLLSDAVTAVIFASNAGKAQVANMSLGASGSSSSMDSAITSAAKQGMLCCVAAGNSAADASTFTPANSPDAICVAAMCDTDGQPGGTGGPGSFGDPDDTFTSFSNFGSKVDVIAPGEDILSTWLGNGTNTISGTSMACPHVTGLLAVILNPLVQPGPGTNIIPGEGIRNVKASPIFVPPTPPPGGRKKLTPAQARKILQSSSTESIPGINGDNRSYPLINAQSF